MLTPQEHLDIAYAAFQTHAKVAAAKTGKFVPDEQRLMWAFENDKDLQNLWKGLVMSILANSLLAESERSAKVEKPEELAARLAKEMTERGIRSTPIGARTAHADGMGHVSPASDIVPGLAVGRCTEGPTDGGGSSDTSCGDSGGGSDGGGGGGGD